ncbi:SusC/RagA family TonB-linked outer membrane protein [Polaribacter ponticola]|uniref:SusC/RagA family TonB-linked outer membrane protein n=1 Tax=Polaribacter ponticola TaxID=2978475 RepID=A0ABT5S8B6_9FLAO|nr:SusC/RagA family TonB-linked outer membrane protein [Polaribacter sp. MSW5]MDD7914336.1 SusC/RagA family TonB-linked outer membrane protein [Polaribacter sp. MSW5]
MKKFKLLLIGILLSTSFTMFAQQTVKGVVKEKSSGEPLPGVSIIVKGTTSGSQTDFDGNFTIEKVKPGDILVFNYLGYTAKEIVIGTVFNLSVELEESSEELDEIIVVGYGTTTVKDATGSVEAITSKGFTKGNIVTPENLLSGRVAGVNIVTSGAPGSGSQITIRGGSSLNASNNPLIVIDGLPMAGTAGGSRGVLASINPNDIESFSVLKDASATAIYGSRGANGVIIITTKKGRKEYTLDYDFQMGFGEIKDRINVFDGDAFRNIVNQQQPGLISLLGNANTNWQNEIYQNSVSTQHNMTVKGQIFGAIPTRLSLGFAGIEGNILTSQYDRATISLSMNPSFFDDHFKVSLNYNRAFEDNRFADSGQVGAALRYDPTQSVYDNSSPFGGFYQHITGTPGKYLVSNGTRNPVAALLQNNNVSDVFRHYGNLKLDYKFHFLPELTATANAGFDKSTAEGTSANPLNSPANYTDLFIGNDSAYTNKVENESFDAYLNYINTFGKVKTDVMAGYSYQSFDGSGNSTGNTRNSNDAGYTSYVSTPVVLVGFLARANLTFNEKYLLTLNYRRDGTSRFGPENRWGDFGGAALAWRMSDEDFLKNNKVISDLKLRASYGINGQQDGIAGDLYLDKYRFGNQNSQYIFGGTPIQSTIPSERSNLKWERTATIELGIDYGLFDNKITGSINAFQKNSTDLLSDAPVADASNFTNRVLQNIGDLQVNGLEFTVNADIIKKDDLDWSVNFNATYLDREIKELALGQDITTGGIAGGTGNFIQLFREGYAPNSFYVYKQLYNTAGKPIEGAYADLNGDGIINTQDRYLKGNPQADFTFGFQSNLNYKNFDLAFNLRASLGNYVYNNVNSSSAQYDLLQDNAVLGNIPTSVLNTNFNSTSDVILSDIYLENASFLRMDNVTLGYTFDRPLKQFSSNSIRLWAGMQNVFTITNYSGLDPELASNGIDNTNYPRPRTFLIGANIKF